MDGVSSDVIEGGGNGGGHILRLPEECLSHTIALTSPGDACRSQAVCIAFRAASVSDFVWNRFLTHDILEVLSRGINRIEFTSMRHLYSQLCEPILIDGGKMSFWLDREKGAKCFMLSAGELFLVWKNMGPYWDSRPHPESRFPEVMELLNVCWLEIRGKIDASILSSTTQYAAYLVFKLTYRPIGLSHPSQEVSVTLGSNISKSSVLLHPPEEETDRMRRPHVVQENPHEPVEHPHDGEAVPPDSRPPGEGEAVGMPFRRRDGWMEVLLGEFYNEDGEDGEVCMCLRETEGGHWKSGLVIQGIEVRPSK